MRYSLYGIRVIPDLLGEGGLLTDDVLLSALGEDVNFDLIDDIQQQQGNVESRYENVPSDGQKSQEHGFMTSLELAECQRNQFHVDPSVALTSSSSDPKLFNAVSPDASNVGLSSLGSVSKGQNANVISSVPLQLSPQQIAALQQQHMLQVGYVTSSIS